jgi:hypothetical protein
LLPVHASGHHHTGGDATSASVIDRVACSYTPTIRALTHARRILPATASEKCDGRPGADHRVVVVAMPYTPDASDLPGAQEEAAEIQRRFPGRVTLLTGEEATHDTVLTALTTGRWAHFACHGYSDPSNPSASYLLLADHQQRPLTVMDVARLRLDEAGLTFLSACSTARTGAKLADEAIHLSSAFQLAGYRHVIATLWPIGDLPAVHIATAAYAALTIGGEHDSACAVHTAARPRPEPSVDVGFPHPRRRLTRHQARQARHSRRHCSAAHHLTAQSVDAAGAREPPLGAASESGDDAMAGAHNR